ncbi:MAG: DUF4595 domain-containing protein [Bacteroidales bacterium]|nr:DUF4595 domain-containing protein [Bacteroidales bacterium]MBP5680490.1 DUF4595 domain-containing protein [Bacteroidales bacterium]
MKKKNWSLLTILMVTTLNVGFVSCDDDDDNGAEGSPSPTAGVIDKSSGLRLKSFGDFTVYYKDGGLIDYVEGESYNAKLIFSYKPNKIIYSTDDGIAETWIVSYNNNGWISTCDINDTYNNGNYATTNIEKTKFSYDGDGHLISVSTSGNYIEIEDGEKYSEKFTRQTTLTWKDGLLMKRISEDKYDDGGETITYTYNYQKEYANKYKQWCTIDRDVMSQYYILYHLGLLGIGPDKLPSSVIEKYSDIDENGKVIYNNNETWPLSYQFNKDGSISCCTLGSSNYQYSYQH